MNPKDNISLLPELAKVQGVSVATLKDGWMFTFTVAQLESMLKQAKDHGLVMMFVKDSSKLPATPQN